MLQGVQITFWHKKLLACIPFAHYRLADDFIRIVDNNIIVDFKHLAWIAATAKGTKRVKGGDPKLDALLARILLLNPTCQLHNCHLRDVIAL